MEISLRSRFGGWCFASDLLHELSEVEFNAFGLETLAVRLILTIYDLLQAK